MSRRTKQPRRSKRREAASRGATSSRTGAPPAAGRTARVARLALVNLAVFVVALAALEAGARLLFPRALQPLFDDPQMFTRNRPFVTAHPQRGFALVPGYASGDITVNAAGFRGDAVPDSSGRVPWIASLGASTSFGWRVADDATYAARLQRTLRDAADPTLRVVNAGVPSYTSAQVRLYLDSLLEPVPPKAAIVCVLWNDVLFSFVEPWFPELLVKQRPPGWRRFLLRHSGVFRALALPAADAARAPGTYPDPAPALAHYRNNLRSLAERCAAAGVPLLLMPPGICLERIAPEGLKIGPYRVSRDDFAVRLRAFLQAMEDVGRATGVPVVDHPLRLEHSPDPAWFLDPVHPSAEGHARIAAALAATLLERGIVVPPAVTQQAPPEHP